MCFFFHERVVFSHFCVLSIDHKNKQNFQIHSSGLRCFPCSGPLSISLPLRRARLIRQTIRLVPFLDMALCWFNGLLTNHLRLFVFCSLQFEERICNIYFQCMLAFLCLFLVQKSDFVNHNMEHVEPYFTPIPVHIIIGFLALSTITLIFVIAKT